MRLVAVLPLVLAGVAGAAPPEIEALQKHVHQVIDANRASVACVLVSRSDKYAEFGEGPSSPGSGHLGGFRGGRKGDASIPDAVRRLDLSRPDAVPEAFGSGIVIDPSGLVLTNTHVIEKATKVFVRLPGESRGSYADVLAADPRADLAVLKMLKPPSDLKAVKFGDGGKARQDDFVICLANPIATGFKDGGPVSSWGIISNLRRRAPGQSDELRRVKPLAEYGTLIQTDVRVSINSSGGAVINLDGEVIGLTTALAVVPGEPQAGYAIPMDANTRKMIEVLKRGEEIEYGFLGVTVKPNDRIDGVGVPIADVAPGMPAARAGLLGGDIVTVINGNPIREQDDLFLNISAALAGTEAEITVRRGGLTRTFKARLAKSGPGEWADRVVAANRPKPVFGLRVDYSSTLSIDSNPPEGVLIKEIEIGSPADKKLKEWADRARLIVIAVDGQPVPMPSDFYRLTKDKASVTLDIVDTNRGPDSTRQKVILP